MANLERTVDDAYKKEMARDALAGVRMELMFVENELRRSAFDGSMTPSRGYILADKLVKASGEIGAILDVMLQI